MQTKALETCWFHRSRYHNACAGDEMRLSARQAGRKFDPAIVHCYRFGYRQIPGNPIIGAGFA
jgi:hypothetical protein